MEDLREADGLKVILFEEEAGSSLRDVFREKKPEARVTAVIGPEGGFSEEEVRLAGRAGFLSVSLGHRILRAETAAMVTAALIQYEWGDLSLSRFTPDP
jgi:16S rRNA (uracil1498-N3)-methyltransferase